MESICLGQGHNKVTPVRLKPMVIRSRVKHSTTEPLRSLGPDIKVKVNYIHVTGQSAKNNESMDLPNQNSSNSTGESC